MRNTGLQRRKPAPLTPTTMWPRGTLNEALGWKAESPEDAPTGLVRRARTLLETPIAEFSPADIRFLLVQKIGVEMLLDRAFDLLERAPLLETEFYPGDLLCAVLRLPMSLTGSRARHVRILAIAREALAAAAGGTKFGQPYVGDRVRAEIENSVDRLNILVKPDIEETNP